MRTGAFLRYSKRGEPQYEEFSKNEYVNVAHVSLTFIQNDQGELVANREDLDNFVSMVGEHIDDMKRRGFAEGVASVTKAPAISEGAL
jgi:hypothetical protein